MQKFTFKYEGVAQPEGVVGRYYPADDVVLKKGPTPVRNPPKVCFIFLDSKPPNLNGRFRSAPPLLLELFLFCLRADSEESELSF